MHSHALIGYAARMPPAAAQPAPAGAAADDAALMCAYAAGDMAAFETLYARHRGPLYGYVKRAVHDASLADELYQDIWERVITARHRYRPTAAFSTWLYRIARNRLVDHWRRVRPDAGHDPDELPGTTAVPPEALNADARALALEQAIGHLAPEQREVILLRLQRGFSLAEIAEITGAPFEAVKSRLRYAVGHLNRALGEEDPE